MRNRIGEKQIPLRDHALPLKMMQIKQGGNEIPFWLKWSELSLVNTTDYILDIYKVIHMWTDIID